MRIQYVAAYWGGRDRKRQRLLEEGVGGSKRSSSSETSGESKVSSGESGRRRMRREGRSATSIRGGGPSSSSSSEVAVGAVLCQVRTGEDGSERFEPIGFASKKFSDTARKWGPYKKEAYAVYFGVHHYAYYLRGKAFILETDHRNRLWIEKSEVPMVVRWRVSASFRNVHTTHTRYVEPSCGLVVPYGGVVCQHVFGGVSC